jgi:hypothetical protein
LHWTTHVIAGAATGYLIGHPVPAALAGFAGHMALDIAPHYDPDSDLGYVVDSAAGCAVLACIACSRRIRGADTNRAALFGAIGSALPDLELLRKLFSDIESEQYMFPAHDGTLPHHQTHAAGSTVLQVVLVAVLLALTRRKARRLKLRQA